MDKNRLLSKLEQKITKSVGHRADLQLSDVRKINKTTAHFMLEYTEGRNPTSEEIQDFFLNKFNAKITPFMSTAKLYQGQKAVTLVAQIMPVVREYTDIKKQKMQEVIAECTYLDVPLQELWEVQERGGERVLVRKVKDDIMAIVQARKNAMLSGGSSPRTSFAKVSATANLMRYLALIEKGDVVRAICDDKTCEGEVIAISDSEVKLKCDTKTITCPRQAIIEVLERSADKEKAQQAKTEEYFAEAYGDPKYSAKFYK